MKEYILFWLIALLFTAIVFSLVLNSEISKIHYEWIRTKKYSGYYFEKYGKDGKISIWESMKIEDMEKQLYKKEIGILK